MKNKSLIQIIFLVFYSILFVNNIANSYELNTKDEELLNLVQKETYKYFYDYSHPISHLTRERSNLNHKEYDTAQTVTIGGSGFGFMTTIVAIERNFITRDQGLDHILIAVKFLDEKTEKFHGLFSHWINGSTGKVYANWTYDNGADIVESAFLFQGLLTVEQYFTGTTEKEIELRSIIKKLWNNANWNWHTNNTETKLYWHWSPTYGWKMNHPITGWDETLITYVLAASSPRFPITRSVYENCYKNSDRYINGQTYYGTKLPLGPKLGGPLFFTHYSFLGLDPRNLTDGVVNYFEQNVAHVKINHAYCADNPKQYLGYNDDCWGITASDNEQGYSAHDPTNDLGVISPTAALSSFPYTPELSMKALKCFMKKPELLGPYGFYDAYNATTNWVAQGSIAIDQAPIIIMIENYRTQLLWKLFMSHPDIKNGLKTLGFSW